MKNFAGFIFLFSLLPLIFFSCSEDDTDQASIVEKTEIANSFISSSEIISHQNIVITNQAEWKDLLEAIEI